MLPFYPNFYQYLRKMVPVETSQGLQHSISSKFFINISGRVSRIFSLLLRLWCRAAENTSSTRTSTVKGCIILLYFMFRFFVEPIRTSVGKFRFQLGEDLLSCSIPSHLSAFLLLREEAAAACRITHQIQAVGSFR